MTGKKKKKKKLEKKPRHDQTKRQSFIFDKKSDKQQT